MKIVYIDDDIIVCEKPQRVLSTDEPGGVPELVRQTIGQPEADVRTVHRLDRVVGGLMVLARNAKAASELSRQIREDAFEKEYLAVIGGNIDEKEGTLEDLLFFDRQKGKVFPVKRERKGVKKAVLHYEILQEADGFSLARVRPVTGRTHQIRVQFASRRHPLFGDRKYGGSGEGLALFCHKITIFHPKTGEKMEFSAKPDEKFPWINFTLS
jgi:23S rRNA pseudouridine1911/1915/1917 synthase